MRNKVKGNVHGIRKSKEDLYNLTHFFYTASSVFLLNIYPSLCVRHFVKSLCVTKKPSTRPRHHTMDNMGWIISDLQAHIDPPPIPPIKLEVDYDHTTQIIKVKMRRNPSSAASETYNVNMNTFDDGQPE